MTGCDIYLFCLWRQSKPWWSYILKILGTEYHITFKFMSYFPNSMSLTRKFYNNERLLGGYDKKLDGIKGEFIFCVCLDNKANRFKKLFDLKRKFRHIRGIKNDFDFIHSSQNIEELITQLGIIGELPWQSVTLT
jgi:hypothetical protein